MQIDTLKERSQYLANETERQAIIDALLKRQYVYLMEILGWAKELLKEASIDKMVKQTEIEQTGQARQCNTEELQAIYDLSLNLRILFGQIIIEINSRMPKAAKAEMARASHLLNIQGSYLAGTLGIKTHN